ncbi:CBO0543 family protein [Paenibacillus alkalitolerans]|uniref:CBO0543 family protein n=1 Tax=Paenibacillus alkalitolerans TaxID=2799335 RepID=UPI002D80FBE9|nr:CBO0543 family protein [Paenibacillus alkalitolerans]
MRTVKHWRRSSLRSLQKHPSFSGKTTPLKGYVSSMIFASLLGTYLDLLLVGKQLYHFPVRLFPDIFTINIWFTLLVLPLGTAIFLYAVKNMHPWGRIGFILLLALAMTFVEQLSEKTGWFSHSSDWRHSYSLFGYIIFMWLVMKFHRWTNS